MIKMDFQRCTERCGDRGDVDVRDIYVWCDEVSSTWADTNEFSRKIHIVYVLNVTSLKKTG